MLLPSTVFTKTDSLRRIDAIPKKRGPKTDVLEALLKRVNGLEKRLKDEGKEPDETTEEIKVAGNVDDAMDKKPTKNTLTPPDAVPPISESRSQPPPQPPQQQRPAPPQRHPSIGFPEQFARYDTSDRVAIELC